MKLQQYLLNNYLNVDFENFSQKAVLAHGILKSIKHNPNRYSTKEDAEKVDPVAEAIKVIEKIIEETHDDLHISLFVLDKNILPQDKLKTGENLTINFKYKNPYRGKNTLSMTQDQIQHHLCTASLKIHEILMEHIAAFSEQMFFESGNL